MQLKKYFPLRCYISIACHNFSVGRVLRKLLLFALFLISFNNYSQTPAIDSLKNILSENIQDTTRIKVLLELNSAYFRIDVKIAFEYAEEALKLSEKLNDSIFIGRSKKRIGRAYNLKSNYEMAEKFFKESVKIFEEHNDSIGLAMVLSDYGKMKYSTGDFDGAIKILIKANEILKNLNEKEYEAVVLNEIGVLYKTIDNQKKALEYYEEALKIVQSTNNKPAISAIYNNIAALFINSRENEDSNRTDNLIKAEENLLRAIEIKREINDEKGLISCYTNMGLVKLGLKQYDQAESFFKDVISLSEKTNYITGLYCAYHNLSICYSENNDYSKAFTYAIKVYEASKGKDFNLGIELKKENHKILATIYKTRGLFSKALFHLEEYNNIRDSLYEVDFLSSINELEMKYQNEIKEKENQFLQQKNKEEKARRILLEQENEIQKLQLDKSKNRNYFIIIIAVVVILLVLSILLLVRQKKMKAEQKSVMLEQRLLRSQMNPHFIFNLLAAIQSFIFKKNPAEAVKSLSKFAKLIRLVLQHSRNEYIFIDDELEYLKYYMDLQLLRYEDSFVYDIVVDESIKQENIKIPPMLAQPFIENAIEHGVSKLEKGGIINISFQMIDNEYIKLEIKDNGLGFNNSESKTNKGHQSLATQISRERLEILNRNKKKKISLDVKEVFDSKGNVAGVMTSFLVPYNNVSF